MKLVNRPAMDRSPKLMSLQYIRAVGAIMVVLWHTGWTRSFVGQSGVDLFFIVSGFVMMLVSGRERSPLRFAVSRWTRIVPLYWAVTFVAAFLDHPPATKLITSLLFWPASPYPVVIQGWSLNLEMAYYALFAVALVGPIRWRVPILAVAIGVLCVVLPVLLPPSRPLQALSDPLAVEFLAGAALYVAWVRGAVPAGAGAWLLLLAGGLALGATHFLGGGAEGWFRVAAWGIPALAIVTGCLGIERSGHLPRLPLLGALGEASYSIYLTHVVAMSFVAGPLHRLWAPIAVSIALPYTCAIGWAVYRGFELPLHHLSKRTIRSIWVKDLTPS